MRSTRANEVEERRVIRALAGLAEQVPALPDAEIQRAVELAPPLARLTSGRVRSRHPARRFAPVAAAAVAALAFLVQLEAPAQRSSSASGSGSLVEFPEGNALQLLLTASQTR